METITTNDGYVWILDEVVEQCTACNGRVVFKHRNGIGYCESCDGLHSRWDCSRKDANAIVHMDHMIANCDLDDLRYFDIRVEGHREHGWYDFKTRNVVQF